jgi:hypothetical protein
MTTPRDADRLIRAYLDDGPTELPDRSFDAVRDHIDHTRQRAVFDPWREPVMTRFASIATAAAAVLVVVAVLAQLVSRTGDMGAPSLTPPPSLSPGPASSSVADGPLPTLPQSGTLAAGRYVLDDPVSTPRAFTVEVPEGWSASRGSFIGKQLDAPTVVEFSPWIVTHIFTDGCHARDSMQATGPTMDELVDALLSIAPPRYPALVPDARHSSVTIGEHTARRVRLSMPVDFDFTGCDLPDVFRNWPGRGPDLDGGLMSRVGETDDIYVIDVDGSAMALDAKFGPDASLVDRVQLEAILASVEFLGP